MRKTWLGLVAALAITGAPFPDSPAVQDAGAAISVRPLSPNYDFTLDTNWPAGNKPEPTDDCTTWACAQLGTAAGLITENSATSITIAASGADDLDNVGFAYKEFASGDVEVIAIVPAQGDRTGYSEDFAGYGVRCQEGVDTGAWFIQAWSPNLNDVPRLKFGTASLNSAVQGEAATALPEYLAITGNVVGANREFKGWQSNDGTSWSQIGDTVSRPDVAINCGVFGTSAEDGQTSFAILTSVSAESTITIDTPATAAIFTAGPTAGGVSASTLQAIFTSSQDGTVRGTACANGNAGNAAQTLAGNCASGAAIDTIAEAVTANVSTSGTFTGLTASTTYDLGFVIDATVDSTLASLADQATDADTPAPGGGTCIAPLASPNNPVLGSGHSRTANVTAGGSTHTGCRDGDDTVLGWDFSLPAESPIAPLGAGIFGGGSVPAYFKGNWLNHCRAQWDEIEPSNDNNDPNTINAAGFNWDAVDACFDAVGTGSGANRYDGVEIHLRGVVDRIEHCGGLPGTDGELRFPDEWTAPSWVSDIDTLDDMGCHSNAGGFRIFALDLESAVDPAGSGTILQEYRELIRAFAARYKDEEHNLVMHIKSPSRGEECCAADDATLTAIIDEWADGYGTTNVHKLAWLNENPGTIFDYAVFTNNTGMRGGIGENWLRSQYTPGTNNGSSTGQRYSNGYLTVDANFEPILHDRHWMEEIEFTTQSDNDYIGAALRMLQMRRRQLWVPSSSSINPRLDAYLSQQVGHKAATSPDAWVWLMETRAPPSSAPKAVKNFERFMIQRETLGATSVTHKLAWGQDLTGQDSTFPTTDATNCNFGGSTNCRSVAWSRREANASNIIGFALESSFWATSLTHDAVVKVTYFADNAGRTVELRNAAGTVRDSFDTSGSDGGVRTATLFIDDFTAPASGEGKDFDLHFPDGEVDVIFVRVIKNGGSFAIW